MKRSSAAAVADARVPEPSQAELDELSSLAAPYESDAFWPCICTCAMHGRTDLAISLLQPLLSHPNEALRSLISSISSLLSSAPLSSQFAEEQHFIRALQRFRAKSKDLSRALDDAFASVADVQRGAGALDDDTIDDLQSGLAGLLNILSGKSNEIVGAADNWMEALSGWMQWVDPAATRDAIP